MADSGSTEPAAPAPGSRGRRDSRALAAFDAALNAAPGLALPPPTRRQLDPDGFALDFGRRERERQARRERYELEPGRDPDELECMAMCGELYDRATLGRLYRARLATLLCAAETLQQLAQAARAMRNAPDWALESETEREQRLADELGPRAHAHRAPTSAARRKAGRDEDWDDAPDDEEWTDAALERELAEDAELWRGHDPALAEQVATDRDGVRHYLQLCRQLDPLDVAVLDTDALPPNRDLSDWTVPYMLIRTKRVWRAIADGAWPRRGMVLRDPRTGLEITRQQAAARLAEMHDVPEN